MHLGREIREVRIDEEPDSEPALEPVEEPKWPEPARGPIPAGR